MTLDLWVEAVLLGLLTVSAWPRWRAGLIRRQPCLISDIAEAEFDQHTQMYVLTSVRAGRSTTTPVIATWDQITAYAAKCSTDIDTLYVCVVRGAQKWYWRYGLMADALTCSGTDGRSAAARRPVRARPQTARRPR
ncbi:hypothetical protein ACFHYQ_29020 [Sphaerimonospora cavernae]|uniref:Uncharacterized protein n=1 Tax=Sphaerimonospora cavernae TaxID=1740611 RepID=A0ABV6UDV7_9ACTN